MTQDDLDDPEFTDTYTDALAKIIEAKRGEKPLPVSALRTPPLRQGRGLALDALEGGERLGLSAICRGLGAETAHPLAPARLPTV
ncbi:hypothetical protein ACFY94_25955 [Streptomyces griseorubiginosus]|uniref:hypothetical protein n=1 Tax=Streptomyces griseorubiginosus TaxID=67304 RepID=UPI0036E2F5E0